MSNVAFISLLHATWETIYMVFIASFLSIFFGLLLGTVLFVTREKQAWENKWLYQSLSLIVNVTRSVPFIILMISIIPLTRMLIGTTIGTNAAIVPLTIAAIPFFARICESALAEVPYGLIEAVNAMGASTLQLIHKVLLPESLSSLIRGATLTIIGLIGYSAMAGVVGGGGLGELAINYGYERFDVVVMLETVLILVLLVQLIQAIGEYLAKRHHIKKVLWISVGLFLLCIITQFVPTPANQENNLRIGIMGGTPEKIMQVAKRVAQEKYGLNLELITFDDYVQPNTALANGSIDANIFQHMPYLAAQMKAHHYQLAALAKTFVYPMGFYSKRLKSINNLQEGALIAIPSDPSNGGRALLLLQKAGLITLRPQAGTLASISDIVTNPRHLRFKTLDAAQLPRVLEDADLVAITNDFVGPLGLTLQQAVLKEGADSPYVNIIVVREADLHKDIYQKLVAVMHSPEVVKATEQNFPNGAAIPGW